ALHAKPILWLGIEGAHLACPLLLAEPRAYGYKVSRQAEIAVMPEIIPRFEFRTFAQTFGLVAEKIRRYSKCQDINESVEQYLVGLASEEHNVKLRGGRLDIKRLIDKRGQLERWKPTAVESFPLSPEFLRTTLFPALGLGDMELARSEYLPN